MKKLISQNSKSLSVLLSAVFVIPAAQAINCGDSFVGTVVLTSDLDCSTGYTALEVANHNVTIDLNGYTLSGPRKLSGINVNEYDSLVVKNGSIKGFWVGINSSRSDALRVDNVRFYEVGSGIIISAGNKARIQNNDFIRTSSQAVSISVRDAQHSANKNQISRNEFYRVAGGISICGDQAGYNVISDNLIWKSSGYAIHLNRSDRNQLLGNRTLENGDLAALRLNNSSYNTINDNSLQSGRHAGVSVLGNAGGGCLDTGYGSSVKNGFRRNQLSGFSTAFIMGLGIETQSRVIGNGLFDNRVNDNQRGIFSQRDTRHNYGYRNDFTNTAIPVVDLGVNNRY